MQRGASSARTEPAAGRTLLALGRLRQLHLVYLLKRAQALAGGRGGWGGGCEWRGDGGEERRTAGLRSKGAPSQLAGQADSPPLCPLPPSPQAPAPDTLAARRCGRAGAAPPPAPRLAPQTGPVRRRVGGGGWGEKGCGRAGTASPRCVRAPALAPLQRACGRWRASTRRLPCSSRSAGVRRLSIACGRVAIGAGRRRRGGGRPRACTAGPQQSSALPHTPVPRRPRSTNAPGSPRRPPGTCCRFTLSRPRSRTKARRRSRSSSRRL